MLYTSRVLKLERFGILISVSISSPDKLGNRWLNLASQSSPVGLAGVSWEELWPVPGREVAAPARKFLGLGGAAGRFAGRCADG